MSELFAQYESMSQRANLLRRVCITGECCSRADCSFMRYCVDGYCSFTCTADEQCEDPFMICDGGSCIYGNCHTNADCTGEERCCKQFFDPERHLYCDFCDCEDYDCYPGSNCLLDEHCGLRGTCEASSCRCPLASECPEGQICVLDSCHDCANDEECPSGSTCVDGACT